MNQTLNFFLVLVGLTALVLAADQAKKLYSIDPRKTRMFVHAGVAVVIFFAPYFFLSMFYPALLAGIFIVVNFASIKLGMFAGMNLDGKNLGTVYYPISFLILVLLLWDKYPYVVSTAMLIMGLADPAAAIAGSSLKNTHEVVAFGGRKTFEGASAMVVIAAASVLAGFVVFRQMEGAVTAASLSELLGVCVSIGIMIAAVELISPKATDNLSVPLLSGFLLFIAVQNMPLFRSFMLGELFAFLVAFASYRLKLLTKDGATATFVMGGFIFGLGGWQWAVPILLFFIIGSGASRLFSSEKTSYNLLYEKSHTRDAGQVLANGGVGLLVLMLSILSPDHHWYLAYLGSLTAATADTLGTEIGVFSRGNPFSIPLWKRVEKGISGGVSYLGTTTGLLSAAVLASLSLPFSGGYILFPIRFIFAGALSGAIGSLADSIIGGTFQSQYRCPACNKITERRKHCNDSETTLVSGWRWINNDVVNFAGSLVGAVAFPLLFR
ncbi:MAG: DUF92 domain-containing protein [Bacteroidetes bacterium]|nr:DUF92 domain-containing protein [Bacteroidota bacterium]